MNESWSTPLPAGIALLALGATLGVAAAASYTEPPALVFLAVAAVGVAIVGALALWQRPRLTLGPGPVLTARTLRGALAMTPDDVASVELLGTRRLAFRSRQLLIETVDGRLLVYGQWGLGADPRVVAAALADAGFTLHDRSAPSVRREPGEG